MKKFYFRVREISVGHVAVYGENEEDAWEKVSDAASNDEIPNLRFCGRSISEITETVEELILEGGADEDEYPVIEE